VLRLTSLSFAHPVVPSDHRARLFISENGILEAHERLRSSGHHAFLLSTCLRVEIAWTAGPESAPDLLECLYGQDDLFVQAAVRRDEEAFVHLSRVAAGLDSPLVGETEVLSQFRLAVSTMPEATPSPNDLAKVMNAVVGVGRTTRRLLGDTPRGSLGAIAARTVATSGPVAILGSGAMARAAAQHLGDIDVTVFARQPGDVGGLAPRPWDQVQDALATFPVVISTVPGSGSLFSHDYLARALGSRNESLLLIDLGMPPAFNRRLLPDGVRYLGVDEVASSVEDGPPREVEEKITRGASAVWRRLSVPDRVGAVIAAMMEQADTAVAEEVQRFASRLSVSEDPERVLRQLAHSVARRVLHRPISYVSSCDRGIAVAETLAEAFGVPVSPNAENRDGMNGAPVTNEARDE
jgi:glutamyl-tRNA reductase